MVEREKTAGEEVYWVQREAHRGWKNRERDVVDLLRMYMAVFIGGKTHLSKTKGIWGREGDTKKVGCMVEPWQRSHCTFRQCTWNWSLIELGVNLGNIVFQCALEKCTKSTDWGRYHSRHLGSKREIRPYGLIELASSGYSNFEIGITLYISET